MIMHKTARFFFKGNVDFVQHKVARRNQQKNYSVYPRLNKVYVCVGKKEVKVIKMAFFITRETRSSC